MFAFYTSLSSLKLKPSIDKMKRQESGESPIIYTEASGAKNFKKLLTIKTEEKFTKTKKEHNLVFKSDINLHISISDNNVCLY